jgi:acylphosphatase
MIRRRVIVHGHVQGVFFRESIRRRAESVAVTGWVRNRGDGSVEAVLEGEREALEQLISFCETGPRGARVDWVDVIAEDPEGLAGFSING